MKFLYFLLATIVIALVAFESKQSIKFPTIKIDVNASGMVYGSIDDGEVVILL